MKIDTTAEVIHLDDGDHAAIDAVLGRRTQQGIPVHITHRKVLMDYVQSRASLWLQSHHGVRGLPERDDEGLLVQMAVGTAGSKPFRILV